ncbi:MAG: ATP-binding cassette domain-containing protein [Candidatus Pelagibacterales bacterium]|nr:MAG: ATP-binding cassette domain-containing protein [Pelagibacterales bacterium]
MSKIKKFKITRYKKEIKPILQMKNISKRYNEKNVLQDLNMKIMPSSITGLLGPNGSGKTTIFNILLGITKMDAGELYINPDGKKNINIGSLPIHQRCFENKIKFIPQNDSLFRNMSVADNLKAVAEIVLKDRRQIEETVENLLSEFSLTEHRTTLAHSLSGGQKKKVAICRALIGECSIMVLDEPLSNIDPITIEMIKDVIVKLQLTRSITILISDHAFENILQIADEIKILSDGYICSEGSPSSVVKDERAREKYFGLNY